MHNRTPLPSRAVLTTCAAAFIGITASARAQLCDPVEVAEFLPADGAAHDYFGNSVSICGDTVIIGAYRHNDHGYSSGSAFVRTRLNRALAARGGQ